MRRLLHVPACALLVSAFIVTGCSPVQVPPAAESVGSSFARADTDTDADVETDARVDEFAQLFAVASYDYEAATSPQQLAEWSKLVIRGTIKGVQEGRISGLATDEIVDARTIVIVIENSKRIWGSHTVSPDGLTYVEIPSTGGRLAAEYAKALPAGTPIVAYLQPAPSGTDSTNPFQNPTAGRPAGASLFMPTNPQSLVLELQVGRVSLLLDAGAHEGTLADVLPGGALILTNH